MNYESEAFRNDTKVEGRFANYFKVGHNSFEFVLDFSQLSPESEEAELYTRVITNPKYPKALLETLKESIEQYEQEFGAIKRAKE